MQRLDTLLKAALLAGLAFVFYDKLTTGTLSFYINQRFAWLSFVAVLILAVLALTVAYRLIEGADGHGHQHRRSWATIAIIAIPVVLGIAVPARPLGAGAIGNRGIGLTAPASASTTQAQFAASGPKNILDWLREFSRNADPNAFSGQPVDVIGFVYRDPRNAADQFWVSRFTTSCCVADASAIGLLARAPQAAGLKSDSWVRVTGKLSVGEFAGEKMPVILADKIEPTTQPEQPYLYP